MNSLNFNSDTKLVVSTVSGIKVSPKSIEGQIRAVIRLEGLSSLENTFVKVALKESTLNEKAKGYAGEFYGLFQIYTGTWKGYGCEGDIFNATDNTRCAVKIWRAEGFYPWQVYTDGLI